MTRTLSPLTLAISLALVAPAAFAQESAPADARTLDTLIVTGTRVSDRTVAESQSPIDIITPEVLQSTGTTELATALARALPSLNFPRPAVTDGTSGVRPAQLRGLSPDQVLILVNGKRRHISALVNVNGSIGRGSSAVDLNAIPVSAIERVEVLRDGASAQYGSDAIAGVVNIVLKGAGKGGSLAVDVGGYSAGDGGNTQLSGDAGVSFGDGRGFVHVAGQLTQQDKTDRAGPYRGTSPNTGNNPAIGQVAFVYGDPKVDAGAVSANAGFDFSDNVSAYATAIASNRDIVSFAFYRSIGHNALVPQVYPDGYVPEINQLSQDRSLVAGIKGDTESGWKWDVSYNYGYNHLKFYTQNSINYSLGVNSPRRFYDGALEYTQNVLNADVSKPWRSDWPTRRRCRSAPSTARRSGTSRRASLILTPAAAHRASPASPRPTPCIRIATATRPTWAWKPTSPRSSPPASPDATRTIPTSAARCRASCPHATPSPMRWRCAPRSPAASVHRRSRSSTTRW